MLFIDDKDSVYCILYSVRMKQFLDFNVQSITYYIGSSRDEKETITKDEDSRPNDNNRYCLCSIIL